MQQGEDDVIHGLYDAALEVEPWADASRRIAKAFGGSTLMLSTHRRGRVEVVSTLGMTAENLRLYSDYYAQHDLWAIGAVEQRLFGRAMLGSQVVEERVLERSLIYNEFLRPKVNMHHLAGAIVPLSGAGFAVVGVHRPRDASEFERADTKRLARIIPHLQRALEIRRRLCQAQIENRTVVAIFDRLSLGVIVMGTGGKLLQVNVAAERILQRADGIIRTPEGLRALRKDQDVALQKLVASAKDFHVRGMVAHASGGHTTIARLHERTAYAVMVAPLGLPEHIGTRNAASVLLFVSDPDESIVSDLNILKQLFGLPRAEATLVVALLTGMSLPGFARRSGLSYHTVRTLLSRATARTETKSQLELVLLISRALAGISAKNKSEV